jgi:hypothetical protein
MANVRFSQSELSLAVAEDPEDFLKHKKIE